MGGRDDYAASLGQGHDADEAGKPGHWRHLDRSAMRIWTPILALQQVRLEGVGHAAPSSWHVITAGMTKGWCDGSDPSFRPCRVRATPARLFGSQLDDVDQPEDHQHDDDHANDPDATTSVVHLDLLFQMTSPVVYPLCGHRALRVAASHWPHGRRGRVTPGALRLAASLADIVAQVAQVLADLVPGVSDLVLEVGAVDAAGGLLHVGLDIAVGALGFVHRSISFDFPQVSPVSVTAAAAAAGEVVPPAAQSGRVLGQPHGERMCQVFGSRASALATSPQ